MSLLIIIHTTINSYYFISTTTTKYQVHTSPNLRTHEKQTCIEIWNSIRFLLVNSSWHNESLWKLFMSGRPMRNWITKPCNRHLATWSHTLLYKEMANTSAFKVGADWRICNVPFFSTQEHWNLSTEGIIWY